MKPLTILIVDDHTLIRESWAGLLPQSTPNFSVIDTTGDGLSAIKLARNLLPDIILLDINMSPIDGFETLKGLRKKAPASKVIAVSMNAMPIYARKMIQLGAWGYITKTSPISELVQAIETVASGRKYYCSEIKNIIAEDALCEDENNPYAKIKGISKNPIFCKKYFIGNF